MTERLLMGGTDGVRGRAMLGHDNPETINERTFAGLSAALADMAESRGDMSPFVIGMDTRTSSLQLKQAVIDGLHSRGREVFDIGEAPTPAIQRTAALMNAAGAIAVTASHNPDADNGWKGMIGSSKPGPAQVKEISERYWDLIDGGFKVNMSSEADAINIRHEALSTYITDIVVDIQDDFGEQPLDGKVIVVDGAHGAGRVITPAVLRQLGAEVYDFACGPDGIINHGVGAADLSGLERFLAHNPDITHNPRFLGAVSNDGDADRMMAMGLRRDGDEPRLVRLDGNHALWALSDGQPGIVGTEYTNGGLRDRLRQNIVGFQECANGDVNVTAALLAKQAAGLDWTRGGEFTGHHVDTTWLSSGDGVRAAAWFAAWAVKNDMNFGDIHQELPLWHERMEKITLTQPGLGSLILQSPNMVELQDALQDADTNPVRLVVRKSGTEPVLRIWGESRDEAKIYDAVSQLVSTAEHVAQNIHSKHPAVQ